MALASSTSGPVTSGRSISCSARYARTALCGAELTRTTRLLADSAAKVGSSARQLPHSGEMKQNTTESAPSLTVSTGVPMSNQLPGTGPRGVGVLSAGWPLARRISVMTATELTTTSSDSSRITAHCALTLVSAGLREQPHELGQDEDKNSHQCRHQQVGGAERLPGAEKRQHREHQQEPGPGQATRADRAGGSGREASAGHPQTAPQRAAHRDSEGGEQADRQRRAPQTGNRRCQQQDASQFGHDDQGDDGAGDPRGQDPVAGDGGGEGRRVPYLAEHGESQHG